MKTVEEILSYKGIYSDKLKIGDDGIAVILGEKGDTE